MFQSTLPMKGATQFFVIVIHLSLFQSTLPMKGATWHAADHLEGSKFQSTLPMKGATAQDEKGGRDDEVSIHAPNEGSDMDVRVG